jgi:hypothetical protein
MPDKKELTPEEQELAVAEYAAGQIETFRFLEEHINDEDFGYASTPENTRKMADFIQGKGWKWSTEACNKAYAALKAAGELTAVELPQPVANVEPTPIEKSPWPWGTLTPEKVRDMSGKEMQRWMKSEKYGAEFQKQVNALNLTRSVLGLNY